MYCLLIFPVKKNENVIGSQKRYSKMAKKKTTRDKVSRNKQKNKWRSIKSGP